MPQVVGETALAAFRENWSGERLLDLLRANGGRLQVDWAIGVGKSRSLDDVIEAAIREERYDLLIVLTPTRQLIAERRWIQAPPTDIRVVDLQPRPRARCGRLRDRRWQGYEQQGLGALGRIELCGSCPEQSGCPWPTQFGKALTGARVIFATQAHLGRAPAFTLQLQQWSEAERVLVILDEINVLLSSQRRRIARTDLEGFLKILEADAGPGHPDRHRRLRQVCRLLLIADTEDLRCPDWRIPSLSHQAAARIQRLGVERFGDRFRFLGHDLLLFGRSPLASRERDPQGDLAFSAPLVLNQDLLVYSAGIDPRLLDYRLGQTLARPFADIRFAHPDTRWYNLASRIGTQRHFPRNAAQILDFFAQWIAARLEAGRRVLGIVKKRFLGLCARALDERLRALGLTEARVAIDPEDGFVLENRYAVPLIGYGAIGTNRFEHFDCAVCLTGFYVDDSVLEGALQDLLASDFALPLEITLEGCPPRRRARAKRIQDRFYDIHELAQVVLDHFERGTVWQAVGRVRPYTRPREIFTFQCAAHPDRAYTAEFLNLAEARRYFDIPDRRQKRRAQTRGRVQAARADGLTQAAAAARLGLSERTVRRYWASGEPDISPDKDYLSGVVSGSKRPT